MINFVQIQNFFIVLMAILGFIATIGSVINLITKWNEKSRSKKNEDRINAIENKINSNIEPRVKTLENKSSEQEGFIQILCSSLLAIISYEINNNSKDELIKAKAELEKYLISK